MLPQYRINFFAEECLGFHQNTSLDIRREKKKKRDCEVKEKDCRLCQVGVHANVCDNSSAASAVSVVESTLEVGRTSNNHNQPSASLSTEKANSSSPQYDFQISEPKVKRIKSTESTQLNSIQTFPLTQGLLSVAALMNVILVCGKI